LPTKPKSTGKVFEMNRLNLGAGLTWPDDWVNVDKFPASDSIIEADVLKGLPFPDNHFDFVLMNHTLQMFTYEELPVVLKEVRRVMKEGATLRILTPDVIDKMFDYFDPDALSSGFDVPVSEKLEPTRAGRLLRYIFWHGDTRCAFSTDSLISKLQESDFANFRSGKFGECDLDSRKDESLIVECIK
jgi:ubiquinone/menaquinone biosynthesis C-methylase UbiE